MRRIKPSTTSARMATVSYTAAADCSHTRERPRAALARKSAPRAVLVAFDLVHLDGEDMCALDLEDRRAILADVVSKRAPWIQFSEGIEGDGPQVWGHACNMGLEGIISKRRGARYIPPGKTSVWRKTMCTLTDHFAVMGADRGPLAAPLPLLGSRPQPLRLGGLRAERCGRAPNTRRARRQTGGHRHCRVSWLHPARRAASPCDPRLVSRLKLNRVGDFSGVLALKALSEC
jgi:hypothetical protein